MTCFRPFLQSFYFRGNREFLQFRPPDEQFFLCNTRQIIDFKCFSERSRFANSLILKEFQDADPLQLNDSLRVSAIFTRARRRKSRLQAAFSIICSIKSILAEQSRL